MKANNIKVNDFLLILLQFKDKNINAFSIQIDEDGNKVILVPIGEDIKNHTKIEDAKS